MIDYEVSDDDLARLADWAERMEVANVEPEWKKAYGAVRQGADWLLRRRTLKRHKDITSEKQNVKVHTQ